MNAEPVNKPPARKWDADLEVNLKREAALQAGAGLGWVILLGWLAQTWLAFPIAAIFVAALIFALFMCFIFRWLSEHAPQHSLGTANRVTIFRAALVANLAAATLYPSFMASHGIALSAIMTITFALDGVDGWLARKFSQSSGFGARFDQELDAAFTLVLAIAIFRLEVAAGWILLAGAWHYIFHALRAFSPAFRHSLPFSQRRRFVCGAVVTMLIVSASPLVPPPIAQISALIGVGLLSSSFFIDIAWLLRLHASSGQNQVDAAPQQGRK